MTPFTPQNWSNDYAQQRIFIANFEAGLQQAEQLRKCPTLIKTTTPTSDNLIGRWRAFHKTLQSMPLGSRVQWYDPTTKRIANLYMPLSAQSDVLYPITPIQTASAWQFLGSHYIDASGGAKLIISNISQAYTDLFITIAARSTVAAQTSQQTVTFNGAVTGYYSQKFTADTSSVVASEVLNAAGLTFTLPASSAEEHSYGVLTLYVRRYSDASHTPCGWWMFHQFNGNPIATKVQSYGSWLLNSAAAITKIELIPATASSMELGSRIHVWGIK